MLGIRGACVLVYGQL